MMRNTRIQGLNRALPLALALAGFTACPGSHSDSTPTPPPPPPPVTGAYSGTLVDSAVQGVTYSTTSGVKGTTDAAGTFKFNALDNVEFKIGMLSLGSIGALGIVTPIELAQGNANKLQNLLVLLQSLDADGNAANGITIPTASAAALPASLDLTQTPATFASSANTGLQTAMTAGGITMPIKTTAQANASFQTQCLALISSNIWAVADATGATVLRISPDGTYIQGQVGPASGGGQAGIEVGTFAVLGFDATGFYGRGTPTLDTNGQWGLSNTTACDTIRVLGDQMLMGCGCGQTPKLVSKVENVPTSVVGAWALSPTDINSLLFVLFSNGKALLINPAGSDCGGGPGIEYFSYSYNTATHVFTLSNALYDTNGCNGQFDNGVSAGTPAATLAPDGMSLSSSAGNRTWYRVSK